MKYTFKFFARTTHCLVLCQLHVPTGQFDFFSLPFERVSNGKTKPSALKWMDVFLCGSCDSESLICAVSNISDYLKSFVVMELINPSVHYSARNSHFGVKYVDSPEIC